MLTESMLNGKVSQYPDEVGGKEEYTVTPAMFMTVRRLTDCITD